MKWKNLNWSKHLLPISKKRGIVLLREKSTRQKDTSAKGTAKVVIEGEELSDCVRSPHNAKSMPLRTRAKGRGQTSKFNTPYTGPERVRSAQLRT